MNKVHASLHQPKTYVVIKNICYNLKDNTYLSHHIGDIEKAIRIICYYYKHNTYLHISPNTYFVKIHETTIALLRITAHASKQLKTHVHFVHIKTMQRNIVQKTKSKYI